MLFAFVQFEFTHAVGPHAGRYVFDPDGVGPLREPGDEGRGLSRDVTGVERQVGAADVLVVDVVAAPPARLRLRRRARVADEGPPAEVPLSLLTFVKGTEPLADEREARRLLEGLSDSEDEQQRIVAEGLDAVNLAIRAYRSGARDPYVTEVSRRDPRRIRIGFGTTDDVRDGRWRAAIALPPPVLRRSRRAARLRPSEATAAVLSGRTHVLEAEDLLLRALADLDHGRTRAAAQSVRGATLLLPRELPALPPSDDETLLELAASADGLAAAAISGGLDADGVAELERIITAADRIVDAWRWPPE